MEKQSEFKKFDWSYTAKNWGKYSYPFRPSKGDIKIYQLILSDFENKKVLLLGATPEIREVFSVFCLDVVVVDFSFEMLEEMSSLGDIDVFKEKWVKGDWLKLDKNFKNNYFDLILGDLVLRNIELKNQKKFLKVINGLLKKDGLFVTRVHCFDEDNLEKNESEIVDSILFLKNISQRTKEDLITSRLFDKFTNKESRLVEKDLFSKTIKKEKGDLFKNIYNKWGGGQRTWVQHTEKEIEKIVQDYFFIKDKKITGDCIDSEFYPIYFFLKKIL